MGADEIKEIARNNYENAFANYDFDLAEAKTPEAVRAIRENRDQAKANYLATIRAGFECSSGNWQQALADARQAQADLEKARAGAVAFSKKLTKISGLTASITTLLEKAKA